MPDIFVTLILSDGARALTCVPTNRHGQMPTVLVDPRDDRGRVIAGIWLGDSEDRQADSRLYRLVPPTLRRLAAARPSRWPPAHS
jgi:hypothetical protein